MNGQSGRLSDGRFAPGNNAGKGHGRPKEEKIHQLRKAVREAVTQEQLEQIMASITEEAISTKGRDRIACARFVYEYTVGKPDSMQEGLKVTQDGQGGLTIEYRVPEAASDE